MTCVSRLGVTLAVLGSVAAITCSAKPHVEPPLSGSASAMPPAADGSFVHPLNELPSQALRLPRCVADNGDGSTSTDGNGNVTEQRCSMAYDCSGGLDAKPSPTNGDALLNCNGTAHARCTCELTHSRPHRVDVFTFDASSPCVEGNLEKLFVHKCSTLFKSSPSPP